MPASGGSPPAFAIERDELLKTERAWNELRHRPIRWAVAIIGLCGWVPVSPFVFRRPDGTVVSLTDAPESLLRRLVEADYSAHLLQQCLGDYEEWRTNFSPHGALA